MSAKSEGQTGGGGTESVLPIDIFLQVFSYLGLQDILNVRKVFDLFCIFLGQDRCI